MKETSYKIPHVVLYHLDEMSIISKSIKTESTLVVARGWGKGNREHLLPGYRISFVDEENVLRLAGVDGCICVANVLKCH